MIHLSFKELATKTDSAENLEKIAKALGLAGTEKIMIYYEFENPEQLRLFSLALQMMPHIGDLQALEDRKAGLEKQVVELEEKVTKLSDIRRYSRR